jgi:hypothetical protein|tara:strand:- start:921 stop:1124 length:204 start_codon:yes stop_codon:yes gene_type:complete
MFARKQASLEYAIDKALFRILRNRRAGMEWDINDDYALIQVIAGICDNINFTVFCNEGLQPNEGWFY